MSNIERNFVQDNGTVKDNISYNPKYYVTGDNTGDYRRIGDIPVSGNYEPNLPYPLDARTLVPKVEYLTDSNWWCTAFGIDTVLYKGMLVTCIDTHQTYIYDGETKNIKQGTQIYTTDWKCQRIDKSLVNWPIDEDENEKIRIGADVTVNYSNNRNFKGLYITNSNTLKGASFYIADDFISLGANETDNNIYPFIPYDIENNNDETLANFTGKQTGIFIPTTTNDEILNTAIPITIYSSRGVSIKNIIPDSNADAKILNQINLDAYGSLTNYASANLNLNASANINVNADASLHLNVSNNLEANIGNNIAINAGTADIKFSGNYSKETSAYLLNSSTFTLITDSASDINVSTNQVYVKYATGVKIFGNSDNKSIIDVQQTNIEAKSKNVNIDASVIKLSIDNRSTNNNRIILNDSSLKVFTNKTQIESGDEFSANSNKFEFHVGSGSNYANIDSSLNAIVLHTNINGEHTGIELNRVNKSIDIFANTINLESVSNAHIKANDFYIESTDNNRLLEINSTDNIIAIGKKIANKYTDIEINGLTLPHAQGQAGILQLVNGTSLRWSKDIGVHHAEVTADKVYGVAHIDWPLEEGSPNERWVETVIISISDNSNSEIFAIKIYYSGNGYTADIQRLSHFSNNNNDVKRHDIIIRNDNNTIYICVNALSTQLSWNGLAYSSNCTIHETADHAWPDNTKSNIYIVSPNFKKEVIYDPSAGSIEWNRTSHDSLIIPWPITKDSKNIDNIKPNEAGFLKFTRKATGEVGTLTWSPLDNQLKDIANNDAGTKVFIVGTERTGAAVSTCNEFYNNIRVYIDQYCNIFATAFYATSDERKKKDIKEIEFNDASILIPKEYRFKDSDKKAYGFIAQEVEKTGYTDIVNTDEETGDKTLDYNSAFAIAISQMQAKIKQLEDEIKELKNK